MQILASKIFMFGFAIKWHSDVVSTIIYKRAFKK